MFLRIIIIMNQKSINIHIQIILDHVLELMGISLLQYTQLYEKNKCLIPLVSVRCIAIQLFNSLSFLHGIGGYIHADLKPENVLITLQHSINGNLMNNKYPNIKIVDLGMYWIDTNTIN